MSWRDLFFSFEGRISRTSWWLGIGAIFVLLTAVFIVLGMLHMSSPAGNLLLAILAISAIVFLYNLLAITVKRLHDRSRTGWWLIIPFLLLVSAMILILVSPTSMWPKMIFLLAVAVNLWIFIETALLPGKKGPNRFGPDPKQILTEQSDEAI